MQDKHILLTSMKKNSKYLFGDSTDEKRISPKKLGSVNTTLFNIKSTKNANKRVEPPILSKPNYFVKTGMTYNRSNNENSHNHNKEMRTTLRTHSFKDKDNENQKDQQKNISKSKTHSKYKQMKCSSGHIIINNINQNKDMKDNNTIQLSTRKSSNNIRVNLSNKLGSIQTNRIFLKKHIVIESKNKNVVNDTRKNNNSVNSSSNKNNIDGSSGNNNMNYIINNNGNSMNNNGDSNLQIKDKNYFREYNQISNYQNIFNSGKYKSKNLVLKEIFNGNDF
jgi:hypothetical protein